jgi:hypothetical protein
MLDLVQKEGPGQAGQDAEQGAVMGWPASNIDQYARRQPGAFD